MTPDEEGPADEVLANKNPVLGDPGHTFYLRCSADYNENVDSIHTYEWFKVHAFL